MKYSIIIPHYNSVALLERLLKSIPERTDTEVLVIDDGSDDAEWERLCSLPLRSNVCVFRIMHGGAGKARNIGMDIAKGERIIFADADDYFSDMLDGLLTVHGNDAYDISFFRTDSVCGDTGRKADRHLWFQRLVDNQLNFPSAHNRNKLLLHFTPPWGKIYSADFLRKHGLRFEEVMISNDILFSVYAGTVAENIGLFDEKLYVVTVTPGSLTNTKTPERLLSSLDTVQKANDYLRAINKRRYQFSVLYYLGTAYRYGIRYEWLVLKKIIKNRSNIFIGLKNLLRYRQVLKRHGECY